MKKIHITIHDDLPADLAVHLVERVIKQGRISNNNKDYCYVTEFDYSYLFGSWLQVICNPFPRKSDCFTVCKKQPHNNGLELTSVCMDEMTEEGYEKIKNKTQEKGTAQAEEGR